MSESAKWAINSFRGKVAVSYRCFTIHAGDGTTVDAQSFYTAGMLSAQTNQVSVGCALDPGEADLTIEIGNDLPELLYIDEWDAAAEINYTFSESAKISTWFVAAPQERRGQLDFFALQPGNYQIRSYGRIRKDSRLFVDEFGVEDRVDSEEIMLQFWPSDGNSDEAVVIKDDYRYRAY